MVQPETDSAMSFDEPGRGRQIGISGLALMDALARAEGLMVTEGFALIRGLALVGAWRVAAPAEPVAPAFPLPPARVSVTPAVLPATRTSAARAGRHRDAARVAARATERKPVIPAPGFPLPARQSLRGRPPADCRAARRQAAEGGPVRDRAVARGTTPVAAAALPRPT